MHLLRVPTFMVYLPAAVGYESIFFVVYTMFALVTMMLRKYQASGQLGDHLAHVWHPHTFIVIAHVDHV